MKSYVSYEKKMRERAIKDRKGLFSIDLIDPGAKPGKLGGRTTIQAPADPEDYEKVKDFLYGLIKSRSEKQATQPPTRPASADPDANVQPRA